MTTTDVAGASAPVELNKFDTSDKAKYQLMPPLSTVEYAMLKDSILENGMLVAVEFDEDGNILDGHHRVRAWDELRAAGKKVPQYDRVIRRGLNDAQKREYVITLNLKRRHLTTEQRNEIFVRLRAKGFTLTEIAKAAGGVAPSTVMRNINAAIEANPDLATTVVPEYVMTSDGREMPTSYMPRIIMPAERVNAAEHVTQRAPKVDSMDIAYTILVVCESEEQQQELLGTLTEMGLDCRPMVS